MTLITEPADRPRSAAKRLVAIWNSCTPSCVMLSSGPPTTSSLLSMPSIEMLPPRPSCPAEEMTTELVLVGSKFGAGAFPGTSSASSMKLRPLSGSRSIEGAVITASTTDRAVSTSPVPAASTTTSSRTPATVSVASRSSTCPTRSVTPSKRCGAKPATVTETTKPPGGRSASRYCPLASVVASRDHPVAEAVAVTCAPGTGRDCGSRTRPRTVAVEAVWAAAPP